MPFDYMANTDSEDAVAYKSMLDHANVLLHQRTPEQIAMLADAGYDSVQETFTLTSLGQTFTVHYPDSSVYFAGTDKTPVRYWKLAILHYLAMADGTPPSGEAVPFRVLPDGMVRGGNFDRDSARELSVLFGDKPIERIEKTCTSLGARLIKTSADVSAEFLLFPRYPVTLKVWLADDELPGSGKLLLDKNANHCLSLEDSVTAAALLLDFLKAQYSLLYPQP